MAPNFRVEKRHHLGRRLSSFPEEQQPKKKKKKSNETPVSCIVSRYEQYTVKVRIRSPCICVSTRQQRCSKVSLEYISRCCPALDFFPFHAYDQVELTTLEPTAVCCQAHARALGFCSIVLIYEHRLPCWHGAVHLLVVAHVTRRTCIYTCTYIALLTA